MSAEPDLSHALILGAIRADYGLNLQTLTFIPDGTAPAYRVEGSDGRYFVKLLENTPYGQQLLERAGEEMSLLRVLRQRDILPRVPHPLLTRDGAKLSRVNGHAILVYEWIEASNLSSEWTAALHELAPLLGRLHAGTPAITAHVNRLPVPTEDFGLPFQAQLLDNLEQLKHPSPDDRRGLGALRNLLEPHQTELRRMLERAQFFQSAARARPSAMVVCHTDAHGGNVMRDSTRALWIIDWETARLAPPEHDLWMLHERLPEILPAYSDAFGRDVSLEPDIIAFYFYRRVLEDLAVDVNMILRDNTRPEQDASNLEVLERYILPSVVRLEADLERLTAGLNAV